MVIEVMKAQKWQQMLQDAGDSKCFSPEVATMALRRKALKPAQKQPAGSVLWLSARPKAVYSPQQFSSSYHPSLPQPGAAWGGGTWLKGLCSSWPLPGVGV